MQVPGPTFIAGGNIIVVGACVIDPSNDNTVLTATTLQGPLIGVAQEAMNAGPGISGSNSVLAATSGQQIDVIGVANVALIQLATTATRGQLAEVYNSSGWVGNTTGSGKRFVVGQFLMSGIAGDWVDVLVLPAQIYS